MTSPKYIQGAYRGIFSIRDKPLSFSLSNQNEEMLYFISLGVWIDDRSFYDNNTALHINPLPYARFFDSGKWIDYLINVG